MNVFTIYFVVLDVPLVKEVKAKTKFQARQQCQKEYSVKLRGRVVYPKIKAIK